MGAARTTQVLGVGGFDKEGLVLEAKRNLILNARLQPGEVMGQTTVDIKRTIFFPIQTNKVTLSAEIIDFSKREENTPAPEMSLDGFIGRYRPLAAKTYSIGEKVNYFYRSEWQEVEVTEYVGDKYRIQFIDAQDNLKQKVVPAHHLKPHNPARLGKRNNRSDDPKDWSTPSDAKNELARFRYKGAEYIGELLNKGEKEYMIRMQKSNGDMIGIYVPVKDIIDVKEN